MKESFQDENLRERAIALLLVMDYPEPYRAQWAKAHECEEMGVGVDDALDNEWDNLRAALGLNDWSELEQRFREEAWNKHERANQ